MTDTAISIVRLIIVDDHSRVRDGLRTRLSVVPDLQVIGEAANGAEALELAAALAPHLMLVDVGIRDMNGIELANALRARHPAIRVLMPSMYDTASPCSAQSAPGRAAMC